MFCELYKKNIYIKYQINIFNTNSKYNISYQIIQININKLIIKKY